MINSDAKGIGEKWICSHGMTLMEVVVYVSLLGIITFSCYQFYMMIASQYRIEKNKSELFQDLRTALSMMTKDIRSCGCDPLRQGKVGFVNEASNKDRYDTDSDSIHITADLVYPWDGIASDTTERIIYFLYPQSSGLFKLGRCVGKSRRPQPVAENILSLVFRYFDQSGAVMSDPPSPLNSIASVEIKITGQSKDRNPLRKENDTLSFVTRVWVPNNCLK